MRRSRCWPVAAPDRWGGLLPIDPTDDLLGAGFVVTRRRVLPRDGYPSLVLLAAASS